MVCQAGNLTLLLLVCLCVLHGQVCTKAHMHTCTHVEVRGQLEKIISLSLHRVGSGKSNSGHQFGSKAFLCLLRHLTSLQIGIFDKWHT